MVSLGMFKSGDYAAVLAYLTEYVVDIDFFDVSDVSVLPGVPTLSLMVGEEVEVYYRHGGKEDLWFGRIMGSMEKGVFPCSCVRKKWPFPSKHHGPHDQHFSTFSNVPKHIRENIYSHYFNLTSDAAIRLPTELEEQLIRQNPLRHLTYQYTSGAFRSTRMLNCADLFTCNRFVAQEANEWLTRTYKLHVNTYKPALNATHVFNDSEDWRKYSPTSMRMTLPLARYTRHVTKLEVDVKYLVGIPELLARYCSDVKLRSLKLTFRSLRHSRDGTGYYKNFKDAVFELWALGQVRVKEVEFVWHEMEETFKNYPAVDREQYCGGFLVPIDSLKESMRSAWVEKYEPLRLLGIMEE